MGFLEGKRALIVGLASNRSIAWGVAQAMKNQGAELAFTYQNDKLRERVEKMAAEVDSDITLPCDVGSDEDIDRILGMIIRSQPAPQSGSSPGYRCRSQRSVFEC